MKINSKVLSIPPFISTSWKNVLFIHMEGFGENPLLVVTLRNGWRVELPLLEGSIVEAIFTAHAQYLEEQVRNPVMPRMGISPVLFEAPLQHNPEQIDVPELPKDMVDAMAAFSKLLGMDETLTKGEDENCNCLHCQISRALRQAKQADAEQGVPEEEVTLADLQFREWDVTQANQDLYLVTNPFDKDENYHVCLGSPMGCTCGQKNCEHMRAVLKT